MSESNRDDNHVCSFIKCRDVAQRPSLPGPPVRIGRGRGGRVEGRSTHPASCPGPLLSLCEFGWALQAREMRGSVCSTEHVFWSARVHGMRERALRGTVPSRTTPWGSQCGVEMRPFGSFPVLPSRLSRSGTAYAPPAARAPRPWRRLASSCRRSSRRDCRRGGTTRAPSRRRPPWRGGPRRRSPRVRAPQRAARGEATK